MQEETGVLHVPTFEEGRWEDVTKICGRCGAENPLRNLVCRVCSAVLPPSSR